MDSLCRLDRLGHEQPSILQKQLTYKFPRIPSPFCLSYFSFKYLRKNECLKNFIIERTISKMKVINYSNMLLICCYKMGDETKKAIAMIRWKQYANQKYKFSRLNNTLESHQLSRGILNSIFKYCLKVISTI